MAKVALAREQVAALAPHAVLGIADSAFNARELEELGCPATAVVPILVDLQTAHGAADATELARLAADHGEATVLLFVGRISPNKCHQRLVEALWLYRRLYDPDARLHLVGPTVTPAYAEAVFAFADELGLADAVRHAEGLTGAELAAWYEDGDVFVCLSEHEGFCIPLLEAMRAGTPIVALDAGAVGETLADAGLLLAEARPATVAAAVERIRRDRRPGGLPGRVPGGGASRTSPHRSPGGGSWTSCPTSSTRYRWWHEARLRHPPLRHRGHRRGRDRGPDARRATLPATRLGGRGPDQLRARPPHVGEHRARRDHPGERGDRPEVPYRVAPDARLLRARRAVAGGSRGRLPLRDPGVGRPQRADVSRARRRRGRDGRRRDRLLPVPVRHHGRRHRRLRGPGGAPPRRPRRAGPLFLGLPTQLPRRRRLRVPHPG